MVKKTLFFGIKILKFSTWVGIIATLFVTILILFLTTFPLFLKAPIEAQLSKLSNAEVTLTDLNFKFKQGRLFLEAEGFQANDFEQDILIATINNLQWEVDLRSWLKGIYLNKMFIDTLTINADIAQNNVSKILQSTFANGLEIISFLKSIRINKTIIKNKQVIEIAPILLTHKNNQLQLKIIKQQLGFGFEKTKLGVVNITATLPKETLDDAFYLIIPMTIKAQDLLINTDIKFFTQTGDNFVEFTNHLAQIPANKLIQYFPESLLGADVYTWMKQALVSGTLQDSTLKIKTNLSKKNATKMHFNTQLKEVELLFNSRWKPIKQLNARIETDGNKFEVTANDIMFNGVAFNTIKTKIADINQKKLIIEITGKIDTQSEHLVKFLKQAPLNSIVNTTLNQFSLSGKVDGDMKLLIPLDDTPPTIDIDLTIKNNRLLTLNSLLVKNYHSTIGFHNNKITGSGTGSIRDIPFNIHINPQENDKKNIFSVELINGNNKFKIYTKKFNKLWHINIKSEIIKGNVQVAVNDDDSLNVTLLDMKITTLDAIKNDWKINPKDFPDIHLNTKNIFINGDALPNLSVELTTQDKLLSIKNLQFKEFKFGNKALIFHGFWVNGRTRLYSQIKGESLTEFFQNLKINKEATGGKFNFDVRLACECDPWNVNYQNITGYFNLNSQQGVFMHEVSNIARILSLLNIKSIAKRIQLNLSDTTNKGLNYDDKGLNYDDIKIEAHLKNSSIKIEKFNVKTPSGEITLTGQSNIRSKQYDLIAKVAPAISSAVPLATYLVGGGLTGLSLWLTDKILFNGKTINKIADKIAEFKYKITGSWDAPIIKNMTKSQ